MPLKSIFKNKCFICIRNAPFEYDWEFAWECAWATMEKMTQDEVNDLAKEVLDFVREHHPYDHCGHTINIVGDSYARIYMFTMSHGRYLRNSYQKIPEVRDTLIQAADTSMPAWGICSMFDEKISMPQCWLDKPCERR